MSDYSYSDGYVSLCLIEGGGEFRAPLSEHDRLTREWTDGNAFLRFTSVHGAYVTVKASRIESMCQMTHAALGTWRQLRLEEQADESRSGLD